MAEQWGSRGTDGKSWVKYVIIADGIISSLLPSACFIKVGESVYEVPVKLLKQLEGKKQGDEISLKLINNNIVKIIEIKNVSLRD